MPTYPDNLPQEHIQDGNFVWYNDTSHFGRFTNCPGIICNLNIQAGTFQVRRLDNGLTTVLWNPNKEAIFHIAYKPEDTRRSHLRPSSKAEADTYLQLELRQKTSLLQERSRVYLAAKNDLSEAQKDHDTYVSFLEKLNL